MPGGKGGSGGSVQTPQLFTPSGLYQGLSSIEGLGQFGQNVLNPIASMTNWAASEATGGKAQAIPNAQEVGLVTGPQINIGGSATPADQWTSQFNPQTGEVTLTNTETGEQFGNFFNTPEMQGWFSPQQIQQWQTLYNNRGATAGGSVAPGQLNMVQGLGPYLEPAWEQIHSIPKLEKQTQDFITGQQAQEQQFLGQGNTLFNEGQQLLSEGEQILASGGPYIAQGEQMLAQGEKLLGQGQNVYGQGTNVFNEGNQWAQDLRSGTGLYPSQQALVNQQVQAERAQLGQQLAAEGLGSSTANAILMGEAGQQGAATAGQLIQGNLGIAQQQMGLGIQQEQAGTQQENVGLGQQQMGLGQEQFGAQEQQVGNQTIGMAQQQTGLAQQQYNLAQGAAKLVMGGQELNLGEKTAMAQLATGFQGQLWTQAMQGYGVLGQMMNTLGSLYGIDISGYSAVLNSHVQQNQIAAQIAEANAQLQAQASSSMGSGLGSIFGMLGGGGGGGGGGLFGGLGSLFGGIGGLFGGGAAAGAGAGAAGVVADIAPLVAGLAF